MKKFTPEEVQTKSDSVQKLCENIRIIGELFEEQNKNIGRALRGVDEGIHAPAEDIESQMIFKKSATSGGMLIKDQGFEGFKSPNQVKDGEASAHTKQQREMTDFEMQALEEMRQNDEEIDGMLDEALLKIDRLDFHAQDINTEVNIQSKKIK